MARLTSELPLAPYPPFLSREHKWAVAALGIATFAFGFALVALA